jgi:hypothetical protein
MSRKAVSQSALHADPPSRYIGYFERFIDIKKSQEECSAEEMKTATTCDDECFRLSSVLHVYAAAELDGAAHPVFLRRIR